VRVKNFVRKLFLRMFHTEKALWTIFVVANVVPRASIKVEYCYVLSNYVRSINSARPNLNLESVFGSINCSSPVVLICVVIICDPTSSLFQTLRGMESETGEMPAPTHFEIIWIIVLMPSTRYRSEAALHPKLHCNMYF